MTFQPKRGIHSWLLAIHAKRVKRYNEREPWPHNESAAITTRRTKRSHG